MCWAGPGSKACAWACEDVEPSPLGGLGLGHRLEI